MAQGPRIMVCTGGGKDVPLEGLMRNLKGVADVVACDSPDCEEAWEQIRNRRPGIVLADARRGGMELLRRCRDLSARPWFILYSEERTYDRAIEAMRCRADDFIGLPVEERELERALRRARGEERLPCSCEALKRVNDKLHGQFIIQMFNGTPPQNFTREYVRRNYNYKLRGRYMQIVCFKCDRLTKNTWISPEELPFEQIRRFLEPRLSDIVLETGFAVSVDTLLCFLNYDGEAPLLEKWKALSLDIYSQVPELQYFKFTIALGSVVEEPIELLESIYFARRVLRGRNVLTDNPLVDDGQNPRYEPVDPRTVISYEQSNMFDRIIELLDSRQMKQWLKKVYRQTIKRCETNPSLFPDMVEYVYNSFVLSMRRRVAGDFVMAVSLMDILNSTMAREIWDKLEQCLTTALARNAEKRHLSENRSVHIAKQYIIEHIDQKITLETLSNVVYLNPVYFSMLFKRETGESFKDYLTITRINMAKDMLRDNSIPVRSIAARVGYSNAKHFRDVFKKNVGMAPTEFRKLYS